MSIPRVCPTGCQHRALFAIPAPPNQRLRFFSLAGQRVLSTSSVSRAPSVIQRIRDRVTGRAYQRGEETGSHAEALDAIKQQRAALAGDYKPAKTWDGLTFEGVTQQRKEGSQFNALFSRGHVVASQANLEAELYRVVIDVARNQAWIRFRKNQQDAMKRRRAGSSVQDELVLEGLGHIYSQSSHIKRPSASAGQVCLASSRSTDAVGQEVFALSVSSSTKLDQSIDTAVGDAVNQIMLHGSRKQAVTPHKIRSIRQLSQFHVRDGVPSAELVRVAKQVDIRSAERFEILKELYRRTGHLIPDALIPSITSFAALKRVFLKPPPPPTVADALQSLTDLPILPNVQVWNRRVTSIDAETKLGRWKVMRKILEDRNLPVTGWIEREKHAIGEMEAGRREGQGSFQERQARRLARMEGTEKILISKKRRLQRMEDASKKVTVRL